MTSDTHKKLCQHLQLQPGGRRKLMVNYVEAVVNHVFPEWPEPAKQELVHKLCTPPPVKPDRDFSLEAENFDPDLPKDYKDYKDQQQKAVTLHYAPVTGLVLAGCQRGEGMLVQPCAP